MNNFFLDFTKTTLLICLIGNNFFLHAEESKKLPLSKQQQIEQLKQITEEITQKELQQEKINFIQRALRKLFKIDSKPINPIYVREESEIGINEKEIVLKRQPTIKKSLESLIKKPLKDNDIPRIAIAASGGGDRAMIGFLAYLTALEELTMLPVCSHVATLSGSTWALSSWLAHDKPLSEMKNIFHKHEVETTLLTMDYKAIAASILKKFSYGQSISACDFWGSFLADAFFDEHEEENQKLHLSSLQNAAQSGKYPFPLFTSSIAGVTPYEWMEYSPFEIGSDFLKAWIPTEAFGKNFRDGVTTDPAPEQTLGYMLGLFGSAYATNMRDIFVKTLPMIEEQINKLMGKKGIKTIVAQVVNKTIVKEIKELMQSIEQKKIIDTARVSPAKIPNFTYGLEGKPFADSKNLTLMDGAFAFNLPFPPLLRRNINLYFVCNAKTSYGPLKNAEEYARRKGYKFPEIPDEDKAPDVSLFYDPNDPEVPVIVYSTLHYVTGTTQMIYQEDEFNQVFDYLYNATKNARDTFIKALKIAIDNQKKLNPSPLREPLKSGEKEKNNKQNNDQEKHPTEQTAQIEMQVMPKINALASRKVNKKRKAQRKTDKKKSHKKKARKKKTRKQVHRKTHKKSS